MEIKLERGTILKNQRTGKMDIEIERIGWTNYVAKNSAIFLASIYVVQCTPFHGRSRVLIGAPSLRAFTAPH